MIAFDLGPKFDPGRVIITADAAQKIPDVEIQAALRRHLRGDWGELGDEDRRRNDETLERGGTLASIFTAANGTKFYVLTEPDRSATTILLPEEY
jgi:hypothetical protein